MEIQINKTFLGEISVQLILSYKMSIEETSEYKRVNIFLQTDRRRSMMGHHLAKRSTGMTLFRHPQVLEDRSPHHPRSICIISIDVYKLFSQNARFRLFFGMDE